MTQNYRQNTDRKYITSDGSFKDILQLYIDTVYRNSTRNKTVKRYRIGNCIIENPDDVKQITLENNRHGLTHFLTPVLATICY